MKQYVVKEYAIFISLLCFLFYGQISHSQTCTNLLGGTNFQAIAGHTTDYYYDFNLVKQLGPSGNVFSTPATIATSATDFTGTNFVYAVTANPNKLRSDFANIPDSMLVIRLQTGSASPLFRYTVNGVKAGSNYTVKMKIYHIPVMDSACMMANQWTQTGLLIAVNPDQYGAGVNSFSLNSGAASWGRGFESVQIGTLTATQTSINLAINTGYNYGTCSAIGIGSIQIIGCIDPKVLSSEGSEVCTGEQTLLTLDKEYNASSYLWQKSTNGGSTWTTIGTGESVLDQVTVASKYRVNVGGTLSDTISIATTACCVNASGAATSRETVFLDDFGHFTGPHTYVDAFGVTTATPATDAAYRSNVSYTIPSHTYDPTGSVNDGSYAVASYIPKNIANWFFGVAQDHDGIASGQVDGGQLFINVALNYVG